MASANDPLTGRLWQEYHAAVAQVLAANRDLTQRLQSATLSIYYDPQADLAIVIIDSLQPSAILELSDDVWLRVDPETGRLLGLEFPDAAANREHAPPVARLIIGVILDATRDQPARWIPLPATAHSGFATQLPRLVTAQPGSGKTRALA